MTIDRNRAAQVLRRGRTPAATTAGALATILTCAAPSTARADTDNPCSLAATFLCQFIPIVPELEDDVDLTQEEPHMPVVVPDRRHHRHRRCGSRVSTQGNWW